MFYVEVREIPNALLHNHSFCAWEIRAPDRDDRPVRLIYYNSSLFYLILKCYKSGLYFTDQLKTSPGNNK